MKRTAPKRKESNDATREPRLGWGTTEGRKGKARPSPRSSDRQQRTPVRVGTGSTAPDNRGPTDGQPLRVPADNRVSKPQQAGAKVPVQATGLHKKGDVQGQVGRPSSH